MSELVREVRKEYDVMIPVEQTTIEEKDISEQLVNRLTRISSLEEALKVMTHKYDDLLETVRVLTSERDALKQLDIKKQKLEEWEARLTDKENILVKTQELVDLKEKHSEQRVEDHKEMVKLIFRNPGIMRKGSVPVIQGGGSSPVMQGDGTYAMQGMGTHVTQENVTSEEEIR